MEETATLQWWNTIGFKELNKVLIGGQELLPVRIVNSRIGNVPLTNLINLPSSINTDELTQIINEEGIPAIDSSKQEGKTCDVVIKL